jgi:hypothetical protein
VLAGIQQAFGCSISEDPPKSLPCYHQQTNKASRKMPMSRPVGKFYGRIHSETRNTQLLSVEQKKTKNAKKKMMMMKKKKKKKKTTKKRVEFKDAHHSICETVLLAAHSVGIDVQRIEQLQKKETEDEPADEMVEDF